MTLGHAYWILMLMWLVWSAMWHFGLIVPYGPAGDVVLLIALFGLLGWQVFGPPLSR